MNVLFFPSSVIKSKGGEDTITICWTLFLKHFRGGEASLNILHDEFVSSAPLNSNEVLFLLAVRQTHLVPAWNASSALLPRFPRQQQAILSAVKMLSIITGLSLVPQRQQSGSQWGNSQLAAAAPMPSSWSEECTRERRKNCNEIH